MRHLKSLEWVPFAYSAYPLLCHNRNRLMSWSGPWQSTAGAYHPLHRISEAWTLWAPRGCLVWWIKLWAGTLERTNSAAGDIAIFWFFFKYITYNLNMTSTYFFGSQDLSFNLTFFLSGAVFQAELKTEHPENPSHGLQDGPFGTFQSHPNSSPWWQWLPDGKCVV